MLTLLSTSPFLISLSLTLLHFLWQGLLVAAVLKSALLICNTNKPQLRYALSSLAMIANLLLPIITFAIIYQAESSSVNTMANSLALNEFIQELKQPDAFFSVNELTAIMPSLLPYIAILWLATITLLAGKLLVEIYNVNNLPQQDAIAPSQQLQARFNELAKQIQVTITPRLLISLKIDVPMAIGWLKPVVLLPASMVSGLSTPQLEMLLLHELAHIRRHDYLVNFFQTFIEILLFFHPAVHWVSKQMRNEREYCSDDIAVQHCGDAVAYAHTLADTASLCTKSHHHTIPDLAMAASGGDLKQRVVRLVDHHCAPKNNISKWFASVTIVFSVLLLSSKQLLTMPLLDIWYNDKPWQPLKKATQTKEIDSQKSNVLSSSTIAQQLLAPQQSLSNISNTVVLESPVIMQNTIIQQLNSNSNNVTIVKPQRFGDTQHKKTNDAELLVTSLTSAPIKASQPIDLIKKPVTTNSIPTKPTKTVITAQNKLSASSTPMDNAYRINTVKAQKTKSTIASKPSTQTAQVPNNNIQQNGLPYAESKTKLNTKFIDHISRQKEEWVQPIAMKNKLIEPITPVWHSAEQVKSVDPIYPSLAKRKGIEIEVKVNFTIDIDGQIKNIKFAPHNKVNYFKNSIRTAIKKWRFLPAKVDEKPVESQMAKVFAFSLQS